MVSNIGKIALGTVQIGLPYGINNTNGIPNIAEIQNIFATAKNSGVDLLDTATLYGDAERKIGEFSGQQFNVVTKFSNIKNGSELKSSLNDSLAKLKQEKVYGYIAHNSDHLLAYPDLWDILCRMKENKLVNKIGYSLYSTEQLEKLLNMGLLPDLVQLPYSLLDRKFSTFLPQLKSLGIEIHVRSVFLQGLYFMNPSKLPEKLKPLKPALEEISQICLEYNSSINALALNFAISNPFIDKVVIGIDSVEQLNENIHTVESWEPIPELTSKVNQIKISRPELLNPANW